LVVPFLNELAQFFLFQYPNLSEFHAAVDRKSQGQYSPQAPEKCRLIIETLLEECAEEFISYFVLICLAQFPEDPDGDVFGKENGRAAELLRGTREPFLGIFCIYYSHQIQHSRRKSTWTRSTSTSRSSTGLSLP
jgi:hypothetical protein